MLARFRRTVARGLRALLAQPRAGLVMNADSVLGRSDFPLVTPPRRPRADQPRVVEQPGYPSSVRQRALEEEIQPIDDFRSTAEYRRRVAGNLLRRFWAETAPATDP